MKRLDDGSVLYEPHERLGYFERIKDILFLIVLLPKIIYFIWKGK
jgi:hypothetical protein